MLAHALNPPKYRFVIFVLTVIRSTRGQRRNRVELENKNLFTHSKCSSLFSATPFIFTLWIVFITNIFPRWLKKCVRAVASQPQRLSLRNDVLGKHDATDTVQHLKALRAPTEPQFHCTCKESERKKDERQVFLWNRNFSFSSEANAV